MSSICGERRPFHEGVDVPANGPVIDALRSADGFSQQQLADSAGVSRSTILRMEQGATVKRDHLVSVAFVLRIPVEFLILNPHIDPLSMPRSREWNPAQARQFELVRQLPNGLRVRACRLESATQPGAFGRLKIYDLEDFRWDNREAAAAILGRHAEACRRVRSPHVVRTYICEPDMTGRYCIVVDEWLEGASLQNASAEEPVLRIGHIAHELLLALQSLHAHNVICRGLSPATVILQPSGSTVIADLELAKLSERARTVCPPKGFTRDRFLAPEVHEQGRQIGPPADLYSWAHTVAWLAGDKTWTAQQVTSDALQGLGLPKGIATVVSQSSSLNWTKRPHTVDAILPRIADWATRFGAGR